MNICATFQASSGHCERGFSITETSAQGQNAGKKKRHKINPTGIARSKSQDTELPTTQTKRSGTDQLVLAA